MEQIYYTQCPMGYGLGASNGFQIKRKTRDYPLSSDFRHLGMKAFLPNSRTLAPVVMRYRRDGDQLELAQITPRPFEYETERGLWGRPGGVFAHGLRIAPEEFSAIVTYPAGLLDAPFWKKADPVPGREIDETTLAIEHVDPNRPSIFEGFRAILPQLLTAVAETERENRTLFLIGEPDKLGGLIQLLTFAFPIKLRSDLTFSTYHERPEELPGYRISGTTAAARPNRPALLSQGIIADLENLFFEPKVEPTEWSKTLSEWIIRWTPTERVAWVETGERLNAIKQFDWSIRSFDHLFAIESLADIQPLSVEGWVQVGDLADWAGEVGLGTHVIRRRDARWWLKARETVVAGPEARSAFVAHAKLREGWPSSDEASAWGKALAHWFRDAEPEARNAALVEVAATTSKEHRPVFVASALANMTNAQADQALIDLKDYKDQHDRKLFDRASLLPLEVRGALSRLHETGQKQELKTLLSEAIPRVGVIPLVLNAVQAEVAARPELWTSFAPFVPSIFEAAAKQGRFEAERWALGQPDVAKWLAVPIRRILANPDDQLGWEALRDRTSIAQQPTLCKLALELASDQALPGEGSAYRWCVEGLLLNIDERHRPKNPKWPSRYVDFCSSDYQLMQKLHGASKNPHVRKWVEEAKTKGELRPDQLARLANLAFLSAAERNLDQATFLQIDLAAVRAKDRGRFLARWLDRFAQADLEFLLDAVGKSWAGSILTDRPERREIGTALADASVLRSKCDDPDRWLKTLDAVLRRLGIPDSDQWHAESLASEVVAATLATLEDRPTRKLGSEILNDDRRWKGLFLWAKYAIDPADPSVGLAAFERWQKDLSKWNEPARYAVLFLNACDGPTLARIIASFVSELKTLPISWWNHQAQIDSRDDIRDAFASLAPIAPLMAGTPAKPCLPWSVRDWLKKPSDSGSKIDFTEESLLVPIDSLPNQPARPHSAESEHLSPLGQARWLLIEELSAYEVAERGIVGNLIVNNWRDKQLGFDQVEESERYRFLAWVIRGLEGDTLAIEPFAHWLVTKVSCRNVERIKKWADELDGLVAVQAEEVRARSSVVETLCREIEQVKKDKGIPT